MGRPFWPSLPLKWLNILYLDQRLVRPHQGSSSCHKSVKGFCRFRGSICPCGLNILVNWRNVRSLFSYIIYNSPSGNRDARWSNRGATREGEKVGKVGKRHDTISLSLSLSLSMWHGASNESDSFHRRCTCIEAHTLIEVERRMTAPNSHSTFLRRRCTRACVCPLLRGLRISSSFPHLSFISVAETHSVIIRP